MFRCASFPLLCIVAVPFCCEYNSARPELAAPSLAHTAHAHKLEINFKLLFMRNIYTMQDEMRKPINKNNK